jgi:hypothetical protein
MDPPQRRARTLLELTEAFQADLLRECPEADTIHISGIAHYHLAQAYDAANQERVELIMVVETQQKLIERMKVQAKRLLRRISTNR